MAEKGGVPLASMGIDASLACLSKKNRSFFDYFYQLFAQLCHAYGHGNLGIAHSIGLSRSIKIGNFDLFFLYPIAVGLFLCIAGAQFIIPKTRSAVVSISTISPGPRQPAVRMLEGSISMVPTSDESRKRSSRVT